MKQEIKEGSQVSKDAFLLLERLKKKKENSELNNEVKKNIALDFVK